MRIGGWLVVLIAAATACGEMVVKIPEPDELDAAASGHADGSANDDVRTPNPSDEVGQPPSADADVAETEVAEDAGDDMVGEDAGDNEDADVTDASDNDVGAEDADSGTLGDSGADAGGNDPSCPASFGDPGTHCQIGTQCAYPNGNCACVGYCGGAFPPEDVDFSHWSCTEVPAPPRADGCPDTLVPGSACSPTGKVCTYGDCCIQAFTCKDGKWSEGMILCPP